MTDHPKIELQDALCVSSGRFEYLGEDTLVSQAGASLLFLSLSSHKQSALQFPAGYSLDAWALSNQTPQPSAHGAAQVVVSLSGVDTRIHVYSWPRLHLEQCLMCEADVSYTRLALSRDGRHLAGVSAEAATTLRYWDLQAPELDLQIGDDHADHPTNVMLREREVRMPLQEPAAFLAFNPFNHTQLVVGNERSVTVVTVTAATSFQIATLTPQPVAIDFNNLNNRKVLGALWLSERALLLHTQTGEILSVTMRTPTSILAMREREMAAQQQAAAAAGGAAGGAETPGLDRSVSNATPAAGLLPSSGANGGEIEVGLTHLTNADLALLGLVDPKAPPQARIDWKGEESRGWAASSALSVTTWTAHLPLAPADAEEDLDPEADAGVAKGRGAGAVAPAFGAAGAVATCMGLTRHEVVVGTNDGCLLWLNKHTQAVVHQQCIDVNAAGVGAGSGAVDAGAGILALSFSPSYATFVALTRRGHLRLFKPTSDRAAPTNPQLDVNGVAVAPFQTSSLGHFPLAGAMLPAGVGAAHESPALASTLPRTLLTSRRPVRVGHVLIPAHPSELAQPRSFRLLSYCSTGLVQLWCYGARQLLGSFHMRAGATAAAVSLDGHLGVIGLASGVVNVLDLSLPASPRLVFSHRVHSGPVRAVEFNREGDLFATMGPRKVFFFRTNDFRLVGYTKMSDWNLDGEGEGEGGAQKQKQDGLAAGAAGSDGSSTTPAGGAASLASIFARQSNPEGEAAREALALLQAEKGKHDDEDELPTVAEVDAADSSPSSTAAAAGAGAGSSSHSSATLLSLCWSTAADREKQSNERVVLSTSAGMLVTLTAPNVYHDGLESRLDRAFLAPVATKLAEGVVTSLSANLSDRGLLYATSSTKMLQLYNLLTTGQAELVRELNDDIPRDPSGEPAPDADVEEIGPDLLLHQRPCSVLAQAPTGNLLVTSGADGLILLRDGQNLEYITRFPAHDFLLGGTCAVQVAPDSSRLTSSGFDGALLVFDLSPLAERMEARKGRKLRNLPQSINAKVLEHLPEVEECLGESEASYLASGPRLGGAAGGQAGQMKEKDIQARILKEELTKSLASFKLQFQEILQRNARLPALEQLALGDFAIDLELQSYLKALGEARVAEVREQIRLECVGKEYVIERIKAQCWSAMEVKGQAFSSFRGSSAPSSGGAGTAGAGGASGEVATEVHNFPLRIPSARESRRARQISFLRRMEVAEKRWRYNESLKVDEGVADHVFAPAKFTEDSAAYLVNHEVEREGDLGLLGLAGAASGAKGDGAAKDGGKEGEKKKEGAGAASRSKNTPIATGPGASGKAAQSALPSSGSSGNNPADPLENLPRFLLYHPLDVVTPMKKRSQAHLLAAKCEAMKRGFNLAWDEFYQTKQREIEHIHEKAKRIQEIQNELQMDAPVYRPVLGPSEIASSVLSVDEGEIRSAKVLSHAERLVADAKAERERLHNESADDGPTRALEVMMGGTLETKRDLSLLEQELIPEEWMLAPPEGMSEEQRAELAKFEKKVKLIQAEQETRRKLLQTELSKLKADVADIAKNFDNKLRSQLIEQRIVVQRELFQHELMIIKLLNDLLAEEEKAAEEREVSRKLTMLSQAQEAAQALLAEFEREYRGAQANYEGMQAELRNLDRAFKRDLANGGVSAEQQHAAQQAAVEAAAEHAALVAEQQAQMAAGSGPLLDEHGQPLALPPPPAAPFLGAGESLEFLYKLFRQKKAAAKSQGKKRAQPKNDVDSITGRPIRAGSGLGGRLGLLGSMTASLAATAGGAGAGTAADGSALPPGAADLRRSTSREGPSSSPVGRGKRKKGDDDEGGDGTMNPYPTDLLSHLSSLCASQPHAIAAGPNPQLLEDVRYLELSERERPESVDPELWYALLERRQDYIDRERGVRRFNYRLQELALHLKQLQLMGAALHSEWRQLAQYLSNVAEARALFSLNCEVVLRIQQGQVEIDESPVVSDLRQCEMIDRAGVERLNALIQTAGSEKVEILKDTCVSRTAINLLEWTRKKLSLEHADSVDLTTELQLLRVTKSLQSLIKMGGHDNQKAAELKSLDRKIEFVSVANRDALLGKKLKLIKVRKRIKQQRRENERLYETVQELEAAVKERMQISSIRDEGRVEESRAKKERMKSLVTRRKLVDLAKLQSAEIQFLRDQVENLRRRTFASFAIPALPANPDERARTALTAGRTGAHSAAAARTQGTGTGTLPPAAALSPLKPAAPHTALPAIGRDAAAAARPAPPLLPPVRGGSAGRMQ